MDCGGKGWDKKGMAGGSPARFKRAGNLPGSISEILSSGKIVMAPAR